MGWWASLGVALLTAVVGLAGGLGLGSLLAEWYSVSSFEGAAGFFVIGIGLLGLAGGFAIGLIWARVVAARPAPGFAKSLGVAVVTVIVLLAGIGAVARLLADVPPLIEGEALMLLVELRWPETQVQAPPPAALPGVGYVRFGAVSGSTVRRQEEGPLLVEDARQAGGRWVVPGAAPVFTSRGERLLMIGVGDKPLAAFIVPLPRHPGEESRAWSAWIPVTSTGEATPVPGYSYRYRVVLASEPLRSQRVGSFEIRTAVSSFHHVNGTDAFAAASRMSVFRKGAAVPELAGGEAVAVIAGPSDALLFHARDPGGEGRCRLARVVDDRVQVDAIGTCVAPIDGKPLTADAERFQAATMTAPLPGWLDRSTFDVPGLYLVGDAVLDTRTFEFSRFERPREPSWIPSVPPLSISPDERSVVWFALDGSEDKPLLAVTEWRANRTDTLPIDRARMRYNEMDMLDPAWVDHHFEWKPDAGGVDRLVERPAFVPLPYRGKLTLARRGGYQGYSLRPGGEALRAEIVRVLTEEMGGERLPDGPSGVAQRVRLDGRVVDVNVLEMTGQVSVSMSGEQSDPDAMADLGARLDAVLATGRLDALFTTER